MESVKIHEYKVQPVRDGKEYAAKAIVTLEDGTVKELTEHVGFSAGEARTRAQAEVDECTGKWGETASRQPPFGGIPEPGNQ